MVKIDPIPSDRPRLGVYLTVKDCAAAIEFYRRAFGAEELVRMTDASGRVGHADIRIADSVVMLSDEWPEYGALSPTALGGSPVMLHLYVEDADAAVARAVEAGATLKDPVADHFYGDRGGRVIDPFGHKWWLASRIEDVPAAEQKRRAKELYGLE